MNSVDVANQHRQPYDTQQIVFRTWIPLLHWILDQAAINAYKLATVGKTWPKGNSAHLEFRRALYRKLLNYSTLVKPQLQLWKEPGPHNWVQRLVRQHCVMCTKKERLRKKLLAQHKDTCIGLFKEIAPDKVQRSNKCQSGCGFCDVALYKTSSCFQDWHSQKG
jgi:hypothetical protein